MTNADAYTPAGASALAAFAKGIENEDTRKKLDNNTTTAAQVIQANGGNPGALKAEMKDFLDQLKLADLNCLANMQQDFTALGFADAHDGRTLFKF
jgi:hypothetical protein